MQTLDVSIPEEVFVNRLSLILSLIILTSAVPVRSVSSSESKTTLSAVPVIESQSRMTDAGRIFMPVNCPFPVRFAVPGNVSIPNNADLQVILMDDRRETRREYRFKPEFEFSGNDQSMTRVIQIPDLPSSREIHVLGVYVDRESGAEVPFSGKSEKVIPVQLFTVYAVMYGMIQSEGWYPPEQDEKGNTYRWCRARGKMEFPVMPWPIFLNIHGHAPLEEFPGKTLTLTLEDVSGVVETHHLTEPDFSIRYPVQPSSGDTVPFPLNYNSLWLRGDRTFVPDSQETDVQRILSFSADTVELEHEIPVDGFYEDTRENGEIFTAPAFSVMIPGPDNTDYLYVQGRREILCQPDSQTLEIFLKKQKIHVVQIDEEYFSLRVPVPDILKGTVDPVTLDMKVYPMFFRVECGNPDDDRPYGLAISEICFR